MRRNNCLSKITQKVEISIRAQGSGDCFRELYIRSYLGNLKMSHLSCQGLLWQYFFSALIQARNVFSAILSLK